jgi:hypothetical protein
MWNEATSGTLNVGGARGLRELPAVLSTGALRHALLAFQSPAKKVNGLGTQREEEMLCIYAQLVEAVDASVLVGMHPALLRKLLQAQEYGFYFVQHMLARAHWYVCASCVVWEQSRTTLLGAAQFALI